jgi:hypothetical protein
VIFGARPAEPERQALFKRPVMLAHDLDRRLGQADRALPITGLRRLDAQSRDRLFAAALDPHRPSLKVDGPPG